MKKAGGFLILVCGILGVVFDTGCSCSPASSGMWGKYKLIEVVGERNAVSYRDSTLYLQFIRLGDSAQRYTNVNAVEHLIRNGKVKEEHCQVSYKTPCNPGGGGKFHVFYENGESRWYEVFRPNSLEASDYLSEGEADTLLFRYEAVVY